MPFSTNKKLTLFRMTALLLVLVSGVGYFYQAALDRGEAPSGRNARHSAAFAARVDILSSMLEAQEAIAFRLSERFETAEGSEQVHQLLEATLAESPEMVRGAGGAAKSSEQGQTISFLFRDRSPRFGGMFVAPGWRSVDQPISAREINMERRIRWQLLATPLEGVASRIALMLSISSMGGKGDTFLISDLEWLEAILREEREETSRHLFCVTPAGDILWHHDGRLHFDNAYLIARNGDESVLAKVKRFLASQEGGGEDFLKADIPGTGWQLLAVRGHGASEAGSRRMLPVLGVLLGLLILLVDYFLSEPPSSAVAYGLYAGGPADPGKQGGEAGAAHAPPRKALASRIVRLVSSYRLTTPEQARIDSELQVARDIQFNLVPDKFPPYSEWREFDLFSLLSPAREVGGDFYDFFMPDPNRLVITVGDVSGKGVPAALYMAVCRTAFRTLARSAQGPGDLLTSLNEMLVRDNQSGLYVTMVCYFVDLASGNCEYAIAGHPAPLLHSADEGTTEFVDVPRETVIGIQAGITYPVGRMRFHPGDTLLLYSDGASEARNRDGDELEYDRLKEYFRHVLPANRCQDLIKDLEAMLKDFTAGGLQSDDITLVAFRYWGPGGQKMPRRRHASSPRAHSRRIVPHDT